MRKKINITHIDVDFGINRARVWRESTVPGKKKYYNRDRDLSGSLLRRLLDVAKSSEYFECQPTDSGWEIWPKYVLDKTTFGAVQARHYR